jgi:hypothetical protein
MCEAACRPVFSATSGDPMRLKSVEIRDDSRVSVTRRTRAENASLQLAGESTTTYNI